MSQTRLTTKADRRSLLVCFAATSSGGHRRLPSVVLPILYFISIYFLNCSLNPFYLKNYLFTFFFKYLNILIVKIKKYYSIKEYFFKSSMHARVTETS
jgi:hypothetical protein